MHKIAEKPRFLIRPAWNSFWQMSLKTKFSMEIDLNEVYTGYKLRFRRIWSGEKINGVLHIWSFAVLSFAAPCYQLPGFGLMEKLEKGKIIKAWCSNVASVCPSSGKTKFYWTNFCKISVPALPAPAKDCRTYFYLKFQILRNKLHRHQVFARFGDTTEYFQ